VAPGTTVLVATPCPLEPDMRCALIRLAASLPLAAFAVLVRSVLADRRPPHYGPACKRCTPAPASLLGAPAAPGPVVARPCVPRHATRPQSARVPPAHTPRLELPAERGPLLGSSRASGARGALPPRPPSHSPRRPGRLLRGLLAVTTTSFAPASQRCLAGHTTPWLDVAWVCLPINSGGRASARTAHGRATHNWENCKARTRASCAFFAGRPARAAK
jgi:hypothetical protein